MIRHIAKLRHLHCRRNNVYIVIIAMSDTESKHGSCNHRSDESSVHLMDASIQVSCNSQKKV